MERLFQWPERLGRRLPASRVRLGNRGSDAIVFCADYGARPRLLEKEKDPEFSRSFGLVLLCYRSNGSDGDRSLTCIQVVEFVPSHIILHKV